MHKRARFATVVLLTIICSQCQLTSADLVNRSPAQPQKQVIERTVSSFVVAVAKSDTATIQRLAATDSIARQYGTAPLDGRAEWTRYSATRLTLAGGPYMRGDSALVYLATHPDRLRCVNAPGPNSGVSARLVLIDGTWRVQWAQLEPVIC